MTQLWGTESEPERVGRGGGGEDATDIVRGLEPLKLYEGGVD